MTDITFENKHPRGEAGKFAAKEGEAANVTLTAPEHEPVHARVIHQVWQGDYAVETGQVSDFDVRPVLDSMTLEEIESTTSYGGLYEFHETAVSVGRATEPDGPSYVEIPRLDEYIEWREENGLTDEIAPLTRSEQHIDDELKSIISDTRNGLSVSVALQAGESEGFRKVIGTGLEEALEKYKNLDPDVQERMREGDKAHFKRIHDFLEGYSVKLPSGATTYRPESQDKALAVVAAIADYQFNRPDERPAEQ